MNWIIAKMKWLMLASGLLTSAMLWAAVMPQDATDFFFDRSLDGNLAEVLVRHWGAMVGLMGLMLIYGAFDPHRRTLVIAATSVGKLSLLGLVIAFNSRFLTEKIGIVMGLDVAMVVLFTTALVGLRFGGRRDSSMSARSMPSTAQVPAPRTPQAQSVVRTPPPKPPMAKAS